MKKMKNKFILNSNVCNVKNNKTKKEEDLNIMPCVGARLLTCDFTASTWVVIIVAL